MKSIYKSTQGKTAVIDLYDKQIGKLGLPCVDIYVETAFGRTHIIETGNLSGKPLLVFHGGNATTAYNLLSTKFLFKDFHIYAVDTIGHPGKSAEVCLSARGYDYGYWVSDVISRLGYDKMLCFGGSFGAGILAKAMCVAPEHIEKAVLLVPSGIKNAPSIKSINMLLPMIAYWLTGKASLLQRCMLPMALTADSIDDDTYETVKCSIDNVRIKTGMPSNVKPRDMINFKASALVMAAERDCLFPARLVLPQAESMISDCSVYMLKDRGHMSKLTAEEEKLIADFLVSDEENVGKGQINTRRTP